MAPTFPPSVEQWRNAVSQFFPPQDVDKALWVITHESRGDPGARNPNSSATGLFQVLGGSTDPLVNIQQAASMYQADQTRGGTGFRPWGENNTYNGQPFGALGFHPFPGTGNLSTPVSYNPPAPTQTYSSPQDRYDFLTRQQAAGGQLGPDALSFLANYGGAGNGLVAPGSQYANDQQRYDYLQNLVAKDTPIGADAQQFLSTYQPQTYGGGGRNAYPEANIGITPPSVGDAGLAAPQTQNQNPYGYMPSGGMYGNQTTATNMQAQDAYQQAYQNAVQATTPQQSAVSTYDPNSGAYNATYTNAAGVGTNVGGFAGGGVETVNGSGGGGTGENQFSENMAHGGKAIVGTAATKPAKGKLLPTMPVGAPFPPPQPAPVIGTQVASAAPAQAGDQTPQGLSQADMVQMQNASNPQYAAMANLAGGGTVIAPEPIVAIGERTGKAYFQAGEVPGERESVKVTPMAHGGKATVGDGDRNDTPWIPPIWMPINQPEEGAPLPWPPIPLLRYPPPQIDPTYNYAGGGRAIVGFQEGGDATVGDPNDPNKPSGGLLSGLVNYVNNPPGLAGNLPNTAPGTMAPPQIPMPDYSGYGDPRATQLQNQQSLLNSRLQSIAPSQAYLNAQGNVYNSQQANIPNQQNYLNAQGNVYQAQQGTFGPQQSYIDAQGNVIGAQQQETAGQRGYIGQQQGVNQQQQQNEAALQKAQQNIPDLAATGAMQNYENNTDYLYRLAGMQPPEPINTLGQPLPPGSPAGVRAKVQSTADVLAQKNQMFNRSSALTLEGARLAVQLLGTNVDAARQAAAKVGLTVDEAKLMVQQAENQASIADLGVRQGELGTQQAQIAANQANLGVRQADLNTEALGYQNALSELPPRSGLDVYTNPFTGASSYMTPAEAAIQRQADNIAINPTQSLEAAGVPPSTAQAALPYAKLTVSQIAQFFKDGQVDKDVAIAALMAHKMTYAQAVARLDYEFRNVKDVETQTAAQLKAAGGGTGGGLGGVTTFH